MQRSIMVKLTFGPHAKQLQSNSVFYDKITAYLNMI